MTHTGHERGAAATRWTSVRRAATAFTVGVVIVLTALGIAPGAANAEDGIAASGDPAASALESAVPTPTNSLRIDPVTQTVGQDATFTVRILQIADVPVSGASATITFDPALLQIQTVAYAAAYADATIKAGAAPVAITAANTTGSLVGVAGAFLSPDSVPAGEAAFLEITFKAIGCGAVQLGLPTDGPNDAGLLDGREATYGAALPVTTAGGSVTLCNSLRIDPAIQSVPQDGTFAVRIVQTADVPVSGASASITFDPTLLQIQTVAKGAPYADAQVFTGAAPVAITAANTTGSLIGVATAFLPPDAVPAGEAVFLEITFKAIGCGAASLGLPTDVTGASLLDGRAESYGNALPLSAVGGEVTTCVAATPTPSTSPGGSASVSPSGSASPSATASPSPKSCGTGPAVPSGNSIRIAPYCTGVVKNGGFSVRIVQKATVATSGVTASILFDKSMLQIVSITKSTAYSVAPIFAGNGSSAIAAANASGKLNQVAGSFVPPGNLPAGETDFVTIEFKATACGQATLDIPNVSTDSAILDGRAATYGIPLPIKTVKGIVQACDPKATPTPQPTPTPTDTPFNPTAAPVVTPAPTPPNTGAGQVTPPPEQPSAEPTPPPTAAPTATPKNLDAVPAVSTTRGNPPSAAQNALLVGLGLAGVIGGMVIVFGLVLFVVTVIATPLIVVRLRSGSWPRLPAATGGTPQGTNG